MSWSKAAIAYRPSHEYRYMSGLSTLNIAIGIIGVVNISCENILSSLLLLNYDKIISEHFCESLYKYNHNNVNGKGLDPFPNCHAHGSDNHI